MLDMFANHKYVILNADDLGITHTTNRAIVELLQRNFITSASLMMPGAEAVAAIRLCRQISRAAIGIHLTLTSAENQYLKPIFRGSRLHTLTTEEGFFPHDSSTVELNADPEEVRMELEAQITTAIAYGLDPTHLDSHAGSILGLSDGRDFLEIAFDLCEKFGLPFSLPQRIVEQSFFSDCQKELFAKRIESARRRGIVLIHDLYGLPYHLQEDEQYDTMKRTFMEQLRLLRPGITQIVAHPSLASEEVKALTPHYKKREMEFCLFSDREVMQAFDKEEIQLISWRAVRDLQRSMS